MKLSGEIDRIDVFGDYARVIDYKTGQTRFLFRPLFRQKNTAYDLYARSGEKRFQTRGIFLFPFSVSWSDDEFSHRLSGAFDCSGELLKAFDRDLTGEYKSRVIDAHLKPNKNGELVLTKTTAPVRSSSFICLPNMRKKQLTMP